MASFEGVSGLGRAKARGGRRQRRRTENIRNYKAKLTRKEKPKQNKKEIIREGRGKGMGGGWRTLEITERKKHVTRR